MSLNELSYRIIGMAMRVHSELGPGLREEVYETAFVHEVRAAGLRVRQQVVLPIVVAGRRIANGARVDVIVEDLIVVEIKAAKGIGLHDIKQVVTYLKLADLRLGLIFNFASSSLRSGIKRVVNTKGAEGEHKRSQKSGDKPG